MASCGTWRTDEFWHPTLGRDLAPPIRTSSDMTREIHGEPSNVGISGIQIYYPKNVVSQENLEKFDNVSSGKYTIGLGQQEMGFCADNEDVVSISLTVTQRLLEDYKINSDSIGFLAVGTETLIDKSKSVKTELMQLFGDNHDIEGVDVKNACFGGTQALFHAIDWVYANYATEKRDAIAVLADIAVYEAGPARCTGGAGAIAVLITPDAAIPFERGLRASHMSSSWDFYKPIGKTVSEYPIVDGPVSLQSYMNSLEGCYNVYRAKAKRLYNQDISLADFSAAMFHSPFTKMVQKAVARLAYLDYLAGYGDPHAYAAFEDQKSVCFEDRAISKLLLNASDELWKSKTHVNLELNRRIGNMYTPSLLAQLITFLARGEYDSLNRVLLFAYGSGSASAMFSARIEVQQGERLEQIRRICREALNRLDERDMHSAAKYTEALEMRDKFLLSDVPCTPSAVSDTGFRLFSGTFELLELDGKYRRSYSRSLSTLSNCQNLSSKCNGLTTSNGHHQQVNSGRD